MVIGIQHHGRRTGIESVCEFAVRVRNGVTHGGVGTMTKGRRFTDLVVRIDYVEFERLDAAVPRTFVRRQRISAGDETPEVSTCRPSPRGGPP